jgi:hypothetical protein
VVDVWCSNIREECEIQETGQPEDEVIWSNPRTREEKSYSKMWYASQMIVIDEEDNEYEFAACRSLQAS